MEQKTITISLDALVGMEKEFTKSTDLANDYQLKAEELEEKIEGTVKNVFSLLGFYDERNPNETYFWYPSIQQTYFVRRPDEILMDVSKIIVAQYKAPDQVLVWELRESEEQGFWNLRFDKDFNRRPNDWKRKSDKKIEELRDGYKPQIKKFQELVDKYMHK